MRLSKISSWQKIARLPDCQSTETTQKIAAHATTDHNKLGDGGERIAVQKSVLHCKHLEEDMMCGIGLRDKFMVGWTDVCDRR